MKSISSIHGSIKPKKLFSKAALISLSLALALAGCEKETAKAPAELASKIETLEMRAPNCPSADECTVVNIRREVFADQPALNDAIYEQMLRQLQGNGEPDADPQDSLEKVAQKFIDEAASVSDISAAQWRLDGDAKKLARYGDLLTITVNSYLYTGGAHGMPVARWLNWDLAQERRVSLADVLEPGQEEAFWKLAAAAHQQWLDTQKTDEDFRQNWPFAHSDDFKLDHNGLELLYGVYTLGPYAMGEVKLSVPREKLKGVVRDNYLSQAGNHSD
ncbi:DUF3298 and DUF4163 domain-containing protein [Microbulbifer mangrovi]|uniref:DUF3298 and DUF4163 domain-containing protein n=1 Tax=Microbulbifer mangrovi TaxID=927787 RepID=UPI0009907D59|nr:DUF3298 and DUF4163 domain-containing protein [Microbulbifer mangrovi]